MKSKKILVLTFLTAIMSVNFLYADIGLHKLKIKINNEETLEEGYVIEGKTYLPAKIASSGIIDVDEQKKINIFRPNIHMMTFSANRQIFDTVNKGEAKFLVVCSIDHLQIKLDALKLSIVDANGKEKEVQVLDVKDNVENFTFKTGEITYDFDTPGHYTVRFYMKTKSGEYTLGAEKGIRVLER